ncbi:MAG: pyroglutamyl-peptidase I [Phycisphaerales bacterium]|nr:pyroglutamyl-peptidase I [Phycisphaerales bacterium]
MARILITGFEPFGSSDLNPSEQVACAFGAEELPGARVAHVVLPAVGGVGEASGFGALEAAVRRFTPTAIVALGESAKSTQIAFERVAINWRDDRIADNAGVQLVDRPIVEGGAAAHFSTLPVRAMRDACEGEGVPALLSDSAGTFLCNELMYLILDAVARGKWVSVERAGFIHLPQLPQQAAARGGVSMRLDFMMLGLRAALRELTTPLG